MSQSIAIFYGSTTGNTEHAAKMIHDRLGGRARIADIADVEPKELLAYDILLLGAPTWNIGDLQDDWANMLPRLAGLDLSGKKIGLFAMGDAMGYPSNFLDAMGLLWQALEELGAPQLVGAWPCEDYDFDHSEAMLDEDHFVGLGLDDDNEPELHQERVEAWVQLVVQTCALEGVGATSKAS